MGPQGPQGLTGPQGPQGLQGDSFEFDDFTEEQLANLRSGISSFYYNRDKSTYVTPDDSPVSSIAIPFSNLTSADILDIDIEGLTLTEDLDYVINNGNIALSTPISHAGTHVNMRRYRAIVITAADFDELIEDVSYTLPPATASTLGGVMVGHGLSVVADGELSVTDYDNFLTQVNFAPTLYDTRRFFVVAADATSSAVIGNAFGQAPEQRMPSFYDDADALFDVINNRVYLAWMNGAKLELAPLNAEINTQTQAITLYARGRSSMAYGVAGVDASWTITALPTDVDGVSF